MFLGPRTAKRSYVAREPSSIDHGPFPGGCPGLEHQGEGLYSFSSGLSLWLMALDSCSHVS